jgi:hypothetical protein
MPSWNSGVRCGCVVRLRPYLAFLTHTYFEEMHQIFSTTSAYGVDYDEYSEPPAIIGRLSYLLEPRNTPPVRLTIVRSFRANHTCLSYLLQLASLQA